ncbi:hypothetical protein PFICI_12601 [Pestalotiopsis fici W106-1]|uniref:Mid2 domain-containing protein n=1 Tax=Pestalotiopsis fici (strain W106-1 / CGMCC3.15140) TaxID=1229662 RepID=W3WR84_PESFW|nr:uncharacterized protein PFICI_12601 [Pestalotiopsis fici W106-1]ETS75657.1 hypothetical protein PFICI_12601 [Pestalotiopsis fici W106-1]
MSSSSSVSSCYYPNGLLAKDDTPCDPDATTGSPCCGAGIGGVCLSNGLCQGGNGNVVRGSCTDSDWGDGCPHYCLGASTGGTDLISCSNVTGTDTSYCCDHTSFCCDTGVSRFTVLPSNPTTSATWNPSSSIYVVVASKSSSTTSTTSTGSTTTTTTGTSQGETTPSSSGSNSSSTAETSGTGAAVASGSTGLSSGAAAGIGVGGGVAVIIIACIAFFLIRSHRKRKRQPQGLAMRDQVDQQNEPPLMTEHYHPKPVEAPDHAPVEAPDNVALYLHELHSDRMPPQELPDNSRMYH